MSDKAKPPTATMATPDMTWTLDLPERLGLTIADAVVIFSRIDNALIECIWVLEEADPRRKRQIAKARAFENIDYVKGVVVEHLKLDIDETWNALDQMRQERNLVAHGVWMMCSAATGRMAGRCRQRAFRAFCGTRRCWRKATTWSLRRSTSGGLTGS
jgi:hypothetical protein